ncbi:3-deoxy-D-manno-octulosonic acid transferase [Chlorobium phaeovibrioides]|uniref:3-deoxy-D-manno-octulosonic acid transferase n=2 Tax=Chlorobium phaeovibrioides TaxID=1094 RepID=A0A3S0MQ50_CHLPH|nr:glycosyltransferase N-terminal domain-containing protein [Chlorobium phaeovibrioides]HCD36985.1 3-deoxy-D-manno-octulosonic acid transferase [Chlorobium sp.]KAA6233391.1 3-deoxy-D-manno-octulosonic acid transferase [Chlorobium phaeovibrioides]MWV54017.1 3-deoxy-D-manno-octulosonic acid transferase [Chlorobium phaeovibrioides]QEQ57762.1 3-deoxy-D-manno-octulosonic acid transferase [Chlorobium phaeovibrioides]RTY37187.1 3-deoxy-D-manno-octulosonic acid transferase [Chlorobium phaeovibrioides]
MQNTGITLYNLLLPAALFILKQLGKVQSKARLFFALRHTVFPELENATSAIPPGKFRIWIHASSVGEFEQARPVISTIKASRPDLAVFVSFLSDSGYNARKDYPDADIVFYLPADTPDNAEKTASLLHADLFMLMRYDFWPNHLLAAKRHGATMVLAAAVLRPGSAYFNPLLKGFYRTLFNLFDRIFTVSESNTRAFREQFGCLQAQTAGEPRIDQVILRSKNTERVARLKPLFMNRTVLVAGSVWEKDEETILEAMRTLHNPPSLILVPHKVGTETIERLEKRLQKKNLGFMRVSALDERFDAGKQVLIIDQTGYLLELYSVASIAFVGGGFGINVHNTLEPAVYSIPVIFGPRYHNSPEAETLLETGGASTVQTPDELRRILDRLINREGEREKQGKAAGEFIRKGAGATAMISGLIENAIDAKVAYRISSDTTSPAK